MRKILSALSGLLFLYSCNTDVNLNATYEKIPIVIGLLDQSDTIHYIKITKTFVGQGNAFDFAQVPDSSYFNHVEGVVEQVKNSSVVKVYELKDTIISNKSEDGIFYAPEQKLYYFIDNNLDVDAEYRLKLDLDNGALEASASTQLITGVNITNPNPFNPLLMLASENSSETGNYSSQSVAFQSGSYATSFSLKLIFRYDEYYDETNFTSKFFEWNLGNFKKNNTSLAQTVVIRGEQFFRFVAERVPDDPNVLRRIFRSMDLSLAAASEELTTYIDVNKPVTSIVQNKPDYTNINNGKGIFSSRFRMTMYNIKPNKFTVKELCTGQFTGIKKFYIDSQSEVIGGLQDEPYYIN